LGGSLPLDAMIPRPGCAKRYRRRAEVHLSHTRD
jgi:hypothetical protein